jgi:hypothetical protein
MYCKVQNCRFPSSHVTLGHKCGKCGNFGHGILECGNHEKVLNLFIKYGNDRLPISKVCQIVNCKFPKLHTSDGHQCNYCGKFHGPNECIVNNDIVKNIIQSNQEILDCLPNKHYTDFNAGMGCLVYVKRDNNTLSGIFMHSDNWGQYGPRSDDTPIYYKFIENFKHCNKVKCPICRNENNIYSLSTIIDGSNVDSCNICLSTSKEKYVKLNYCNHAISCKSCFRQYLKT